MSHDYDVIVPEARWPTALQFQAALDARGTAVKLQDIEDWDIPLPLDWEPEFPVTLQGRPVGFEILIDQISSRTEADRTTKSQLIEALEQHGMDSGRVIDGAYVFSVALRHGADEWESARQLMSALVIDFGGYGFEFQAGTAGGQSWADSLGATLAAGKQEYDRLVQLIAASPEDHPPTGDSRSFWGRITGYLTK